MKALVASILFCLLASLMSSCGGNGGIGVGSPFAGSFSGDWTSPDGNTSGFVDITVDTNGHFHGTIHDDGSGADGTFNGTIGDNGSVSGTITYPGTQGSTTSGTFAYDYSGHLVGVVTQTFSDGGSVTVTFDLRRT